MMANSMAPVAAARPPTPPQLEASYYPCFGALFTCASSIQRIAGKTIKFFVAEAASLCFTLICWMNRPNSKIEAFRQQLSPHLQEAARVTSQMIVEHYTYYFNEVGNLPVSLRPEWIAPYYDEAWGHSLQAMTARKLYNSHSESMRALIELNILKLLTSLKERFQAKHASNPNLVIDILQSAITPVQNHFGAPENSKGDLRALEEDLLSLLYPQGSEGLETPGPLWLQPFLQRKMWHVLKMEVMPHLMRGLHRALFAPEFKQLLLHVGAKKLCHIIEEEVDLPAAALPTNEACKRAPAPSNLASTITSTVTAFLNNVSPQHLQTLTTFISPEDLGKKLSAKATSVLLQLDFEKLVEHSVKKVLPLMNLGGKWADNETKPTFVVAPFKAPTLEEHCQYELMKHDTFLQDSAKKATETLLQQIGHKTDGLSKIIERLNRPEAPVVQAPAQSLFGGLFKAIAARAALIIGPTMAARELRDLSLKTVQKLSTEPHSNLIPRVVCDGVAALRRFRF